jgi:hypothetical protein
VAELPGKEKRTRSPARIREEVIILLGQLAKFIEVLR